MTETAALDDVREMFREMVLEDRERREEMAREDRERKEEMARLREEMARLREESIREERELREESIREERKRRKESIREERNFREKSIREERNLREESFREERKLREEMVREDRERWAALDRQFQETDRTVQAVSTQIGRLGGRWGEFVEGLVAPACNTLFAQRGIPVHKTSRNIKAKLPGGRHMEIDVLVVNTDAVVLVEVKSTLTVEDVREFITRLAEFKTFFPEYADKRIIGAVAGIVIEENVDRFAMKKGLFVMVQSGELVQIANDETFIPHTW